MRFTPTCVGTFDARGWPQNPALVHPHVRGDIQMSGFLSRASVGSPPRAWGHFSFSPLVLVFVGFTPTCVGTFTKVLKNGRWKRVHPHVRGDILRPSPRIAVPVGSPPRAWGH